jgi:tetratricopeptide (TPR) repeat protein
MSQEQETASVAREVSRARRQALSPSQACRAGMALHRQGRLPEAEQVYRAVLQMAPDHAGAMLQLGNLCRQRGEFEEAVSLIERALALDPKSAQTHNDLGIVLSALRRPGEAAEHYAKAVALEPGFADAHNNLGNALRSLGRDEEAIAAFEKALAINPNFAEAHNNLGNALAGLRRHAEAIAHYERAVAIKPELAEAYFNCGIALAALPRPEQAIVQYEKTIALRPDYADAYAGIGQALARLGRYADAIGKFEQALALKPGSAEAHNSLGNVLVALDRHDEAAAHYRRAIEIRPHYGEAHNNLGNVLVHLNRHEEAVDHYRKALALSPSSYETFNNLGGAFLSLKRPEEALAMFQQALIFRPGLPETPHNIGSALAAMDRHSDAVPHYRSALALRPDFAVASCNLGAALLQLNRVDEAIACFDRALASDSRLAAAHDGLGHAYVTLGRLAEAQHKFDTALALEPKRAEFYRSIADFKRMRADDPHFLAMEELARDIDSLPADQQIALHFALGKAYADVEQHDRSFRHLLAGNALKRRQIDYDEAAEFARLRRAKAVITAELIARMRGLGDPSEVPVFIVGMPRSGTTLVEQILASHPRVFGADELMDFPRLAAAVCEPPGATVPYPEMLHSMPADGLRRLGASYLAAVTPKAPAADRITDKLPGNFRLVGLIHLALPNARIIHLRRDPVDTCLSCFSKLFTGRQPFAYDLGELGRYYRAYDALMAHWRAVLPAGVMLEVQYEDLVADFAPQARRIVTHCGLEWDERCLSFHQTQRSVRTASATQVRQPLYRSAVGRAQPYAAMLGPLIEALRSEDGK